MQNYVIPMAIQYYKGLLKVDPLKEKLKIPQNLTSCLDAQFPEVHKTIGNLIKVGVESDIIIYFTFFNSTSNPYAAYGTACLFDQDQNYRPIIGTIQLNMAYIIPSPIEYKNHVNLIIHEMAHVFAFSAKHYKFFVDEQGFLLGEENVIEQDSRNISYLKTKKVVEFGRKHFNCTKLEKVPLESVGGGATKGQHWDINVLGDELLVGSVPPSPIMSNFTLSVFEDSGWYQVDYSKAQNFQWGKNGGCEFLDNPCLNSQFFCNKNNEMICSYDHTSISQCTVSRLSQVQFNNQGCKTGQMIKDCRQFSHNSTILFTQQEFGSDSRCFVVGKQDEQEPRCYKHICDHEKKTVFLLIGTKSFICDKEEIDIGRQQKVICPKYEQICQENYFCSNFCMGIGYCQQDGCECLNDLNVCKNEMKIPCQNNCDNKGKCDRNLQKIYLVEYVIVMMGKQEVHVLEFKFKLNFSYLFNFQLIFELLRLVKLKILKQNQQYEFHSLTFLFIFSNMIFYSGIRNLLS